MSGSGFAQALVFGFMANPASTRLELGQMATHAGMKVSVPGLDKRFTARAAYFLDSLLAEAIQTLVTSQPSHKSILSRFAGVYVQDSTQVALPEALARVFQGNNGPADAAVKIAVEWDVAGGGLGLWLSDATVHDQRTALNGHSLPAGALRLADLGFFNLARFEADQTAGVYFFSRYKMGTSIYTVQGQKLDLEAVLKRQAAGFDLAIELGERHLPCRLLALPVPPEQVRQRRRRLRETSRRKQQPLTSRALALAQWTLYVTNIPPALLRLEEAPLMGATRWQIECLFDIWKNEGHLDETRSHDPMRVWCEFYAKLLALLIQHWMVVVGCGWQLNRSFYQAIRLLHKRACCLLDALKDLTDLIWALQQTALIMETTCHVSKRGAHPSTFQGWFKSLNV